MKYSLDVKSFMGTMVTITVTTDIKEAIKNQLENIMKKINEFQVKDSGWAMLRFLKIEGNINQC